MGTSAENVTGPIAAADTTGRTGVMRIAVSGSAQNFALPTSGAAPGKRHTLPARWLRIAAAGVNVQWAFGVGSAPTIALNQAAAVGTGHAAAGATLFNGIPEQVLVPSEATHVGFIGESAAGYLELYVSDQPIA
jgi:hypothetical protein